MRRRAIVVLVAFVVTACTPATEEVSSTAPGTTAPPQVTTTTEPRSDLPWWNDRVFYEVFVRSFKDSDGDGVGDFDGLTASLDYLNDGDPTTTDDLGVTGIWLMPVFASPSYHGYDVTDYRIVNPEYGTMEDFQAFLDAAHERGIAVLIDLVINHTSSEHPWFIASAAGDPEYADWYLWSDDDPGTKAPWGTDAWHPKDGRYFFGLFWEGMPDLNLANPDVTAEMYDVARYWLDLGVDGFRLDAARHLIEEGDVVSDTPETVAWLDDFNTYVHSVDAEAMVVAEVWTDTETISTYIPGAFDVAFEFQLSEDARTAIAGERGTLLADAIETAQATYPPLQYAPFLTNHDQERVMSEFDGNVGQAKLGAVWLATTAGVPFVYYGEEVGLQGTKPDEQIRTPMPWTPVPPEVGFTTGIPWEPAYPGYETFNVETEDGDPDSLLDLYRTLIHYRNESVALRRGDVVRVASDTDTVVSYLRSVDDDHVLVVLNLSNGYAEAPTLDLASGPLAGYAGVTPVVGPPANAPVVNADGGFDAYVPLETIPPYGFLVLEFTEEATGPPPSTTTTSTTTIPGATDADVAVIEAFDAAMSEGRFDELADFFAPDAVFTTADGFQIAMFDPLPDEAGFEEDWDWNGDGTVTLMDVFQAQAAWNVVVATVLESDCAPDGPFVVCDLLVSDVFDDAAGDGPFDGTQQWTVRDGLITGYVETGTPELTPEEQARWVEQVAAYESWLAEMHPEEYEIVFVGPCCAGDASNLRFTPQSMDVQRTLVPEWAASLE